MIPNSAVAGVAKSESRGSSDSESDSSNYPEDIAVDEEMLYRDMNYSEDLNWEDQLNDDFSTEDQLPDEGINNNYHSKEYGSKMDRGRFDQVQRTPLTLMDDLTSSFLLQSAVDSDDEDYDDDNDDDDELSSPSDADDNLFASKLDSFSKSDEEAQSPVKLEPKVKKTKKKSALFICLTYCKYDAVHRIAKRFGFKEVMEFDEWNLFWTDGCVTLSRMMDMKKFQKINHFPGMSEICRKDLLARNMNRMLKSFPKDYNIFPKTWCLPADSADFQSHARRQKNRTYIIKPESGCQGRGIWLTRKTKEISTIERLICQQYISKPFLIDGLKFDFRIYVVVTSIDPFRIYLFKDGLARFATTKYAEPLKNNVGNIFMHLTNYAINKTHYGYTVDDEAGNKRRISTVIKWLEKKNFDVKKLWAEIDDVIIKTLISAHSALKQNYRSCFLNHEQVPACFDILGFDILLDYKLKPYLLEVNHSPSFHTDTELDKEIKETLIYDTLRLVNFEAVDRKQCIEEEKRRIMTRLTTGKKSNESNGNLDDSEKINDEQVFYERTHLGNFRCIFPPSEGTGRYDKFFATNSSVYQETATFRAHVKCSRVQREKILRRKEELDFLQKRKKDPVKPESPESGKSNTKSRIQKFNSMPNATRTLTSSHFPGIIAYQEENARVKALVARQELLQSMGLVQFIRNMFDQDLTKNLTENLELSSSSCEKKDAFQGRDFDQPSDSIITVSDPTSTLANITSTTIPDLETTYAPTLDNACILSKPHDLSEVTPESVTRHVDLPQLSATKDIGEGVVTSVRNSRPPENQSPGQKTVGTAFIHSLPCNMCVSTAVSLESGHLKPLGDLFASPKRCISSSLYPFLRYAPALGHRIARDRRLNRMLSNHPHQHEFKTMLGVCRDPSASNQSLLNRSGVKFVPSRNQVVASSAGANSSVDRVKSIKNLSINESKKVVKTEEKQQTERNSASGFLEISRLELRPLNQK